MNSDGNSEDIKKKKKKKKKKREKRKEELIADFKDGYPEGWAFAVGECFKAALDIKLTERMENVKGIQAPKLVWTQGHYLTFSQGDILYDTPKAYELPWGEALKHIKRCCQVVQATPDTIDETGEIKPGSVVFTITKPKPDFSGLEDGSKRYEMSQAEFVDFLKTGNLP